MDGKEIKTIQKLFPVIRTLFSTAGRQYPWFFVMEALKTLIQIFQPFLGLFLTPLLVDELCGGRNVRTLATYAAVLVIGECVLSILLARVNTTLQKYQERLDNYFAMEISRHSMGLDFQLTEDKKALDQLEKAVTGMSWYSGGAYGIGEQVFMFIGNVFKIAGFVTVITVHAPALLIVVLIYVVISGWIRSKLNEIELISYGNLSKSNRLFGYFGWEVVDFRFGKDIRLYDARRMLVEKWKKYTEESIGAWKWRADKGYPYNLALDGAGLVRSLITYFYAGYLVIREAFSIGIFTQMISAAGGLDATLGGLVWNVQELMKRCNYAYEYVLFMEYPEAMPKGTAHVKPGEHLSIVGLNGAGKTTFIKLLCRLYDPTEGEILVDGRNIMEYDYKEYVGQFAPVFQDFKIFGFSIGENIVFDNMDQVRLKEILKLTGLDGMTQKLPKGVDTPVFKMFEEDGIEPSGGEQQKMAIARALYKNASVIILDEPTAALDPLAEYEIYKQFHSLVGDKTAFYISHRLSSCRFCDKIAVFSEGGIAEYGSHEELVNISGGIYAKMFEAQAQYYK